VEDAWDGEWYRRAYFDDGTPLGSKDNIECRIDAIAQSWAVIAGGGDPARAAQEMASADRHLVREQDKIILLLTPPFDRMKPTPGYIQGYVPGVRENGGQYTHAALWTVLAFAGLGDGDRTAELFALLNPVNHGRTREDVERYRSEPYVVAADVYSRPPHTGRGGWTWYTGSAGWMYRLVMESLLGLRLEADTLRLEPCLPAHWQAFKIHYRYRETVYHITVSQTHPGDDGTRAGTNVTVDGVMRHDGAIPLRDDHQEHSVEVRVHAQ
jgi:cellobiose phosphorylase